MKQKILILFVLTALLSGKMLSQPYVDVVNFNYQTLSTIYKDNLNWKNTTDNYSLGLFLPKEFKNGNALLFRVGGESINTFINQDVAYSLNLSSVSLAMGFQRLSKDKKWSAVLLGISKWASDKNINFSANDWQYGGYFLESYKPNEKVKIKVGLYYNREVYGDLFMPLVGIDWNATKRLKLYGTLPSNYKVEYNVLKNKLYTGINFKINSNSYNLSQKKGDYYALYNEMHLKLFADYFMYKNILLYGEIGCPLGKNPLEYKTNNLIVVSPQYARLKITPVFIIGVAYRVRFDLEK